MIETIEPVVPLKGTRRCGATLIGPSATYGSGCFSNPGRAPCYCTVRRATVQLKDGKKRHPLRVPRRSQSSSYPRYLIGQARRLTVHPLSSPQLIFMWRNHHGSPSRRPSSRRTA